MHKRISSFPFFEPPEDESKDDFDARHVTMLLDCARLVKEYGSDGGIEIDQLVQREHFREDAYGIAMGLAEDFWRCWEEHGLAARGGLPDMILKLALAWCGIVARMAFIAGVERGKMEGSLGPLLADVDLSGVGEGGDGLG